MVAGKASHLRSLFPEKDKAANLARSMYDNIHVFFTLSPPFSVFYADTHDEGIIPGVVRSFQSYLFVIRAAIGAANDSGHTLCFGHAVKKPSSMISGECHFSCGFVSGGEEAMGLWTVVCRDFFLVTFREKDVATRTRSQCPNVVKATPLP